MYLHLVDFADDVVGGEVLATDDVQTKQVVKLHSVQGNLGIKIMIIITKKNN